VANWSMKFTANNDKKNPRHTLIKLSKQVIPARKKKSSYNAITVKGISSFLLSP